MKIAKLNMAIFATALAMAQSAGAESLKVSGLYSSLAADTSDIKSIVVDRFQGDLGDDVSIVLTRLLSQVTIDKTPYFFISNSAAARQPDAILSGSARMRVSETKTIGSRKRCVARDEKGKCTDKKNVKVRCKQRIVSFDSDFQLIAQGDGRTLYDARKPDTHISDKCEGEYYPTSLSTIANDFVDKAALAVRRDIAPEWREEAVSVLESTKGMDLTSERDFSAAVKMTKRDPVGACDAWSALAEKGLRHRSLSFNLGLCAEQANDLAKAMDQYRATQEDFESKGRVKESLKRVGDKRRAIDEWQSRIPAKVTAQGQ